MALANARFNAAGRFFWDESAPSLEAQVLRPMQDPIEMGLAPGALERKVAATAFYPALFTAAFGSPRVTRERIAAALAQFVRSLVSARSRLDAVYATGSAPDSTVMTAAEREGLRLFTTIGCINCHRTIAFFADKASNNGLDTIAPDTGAGEARFKPPSLRNVAVRPPYMHDGRFTTLRQVVEFYDHGVRNSPALDPRLRLADGAPRKLQLSPRQVGALVAFMESLTDSTFLQDERFSNPFPCAPSSRLSVPLRTPARSTGTESPRHPLSPAG
jgi:cytochrome c peroxidase